MAGCKGEGNAPPELGSTKGVAAHLDVVGQRQEGLVIERELENVLGELWGDEKPAIGTGALAAIEARCRRIAQHGKTRIDW